MESSAYSVYQYNPPYTLPWLRRNELAVKVRAPLHARSAWALAPTPFASTRRSTFSLQVRQTISTNQPKPKQR